MCLNGLGMHTCTCTCTHICTCMHMHMCMHTHTCTCMCMCMYKCKCMCMHMCTHTHAHMHMHVHMHAHLINAVQSDLSQPKLNLGAHIRRSESFASFGALCTAGCVPSTWFNIQNCAMGQFLRQFLMPLNMQNWSKSTQKTSMNNQFSKLNPPHGCFDAMGWGSWPGGIAWVFASL